MSNPDNIIDISKASTPDLGGNPNLGQSNDNSKEGPSIGVAVDSISKILKEYTKTEATNILKMIGATYNVRFVPAFAPLVQQQQVVTRDTRNQKNPRQQPKADPKVKGIKSSIRDLNLQISKKSKVSGGAPLDESDDLITRRNQLFRELKSPQNKKLETVQETLGGQAERAPEGGTQKRAGL